MILLVGFLKAEIGLNSQIEILVGDEVTRRASQEGANSADNLSAGSGECNENVHFPVPRSSVPFRR